MSDETNHNLWGTPSVVVDECIRQLAKDSFFGPRNQHYLEPAAGAGAWTSGLLRASVETNRIKAIDRLGWMCDLHKVSTGIRCLQMPFLEWAAEQPQQFGYVAIGNPPFGSGIEMEFVMALKRICIRFALILPIGMLEPAKNRPDGLYDNLQNIYPLRRIKFVNIVAGHSDGQKAGSRPVALMVYNMAQPCRTIVGYEIQNRLSAIEAAAKKARQDS